MTQVGTRHAGWIVMLLLAAGWAGCVAPEGATLEPLAGNAADEALVPTLVDEVVDERRFIAQVAVVDRFPTSDRCATGWGWIVGSDAGYLGGSSHFWWLNPRPGATWFTLAVHANTTEDVEWRACVYVTSTGAFLGSAEGQPPLVISTPIPEGEQLDVYYGPVLATPGIVTDGEVKMHASWWSAPPDGAPVGR